MTAGLRRLVNLTNNNANDSLRGKVIKNVGWIGALNIAELVIRFASSVVLTRLLNPSAYGMIETVMVFATFAAMISDLGIRPIVLADPRGDDRQFLGTLWTLQIVRGLVISIALAGIAFAWSALLARGAIAPTSSYADPTLPQLLLVIALSPMVTSFSSLNEYRTIRHLQRSTLSIMDIAVKALTTVVTIGLVYVFRSVEALAVSILLGALLRAVMTHVMLAGPRMMLRLDFAEIRKVLNQSRWVAANTALTLVTTQTDKVLVGYAFGLEVLGVYAIAQSICSIVTRPVDQLNLDIGVPLVRALLDRPQVERTQRFYRFRLPLDLFCATLSIGMVVFGQLFFKIVYDPRYALGGVIFSFLALKVALQPMSLLASFFYAEMRYKFLMAVGLVRSVLFLSCLGVAVYLDSLTMMIIVIALEKLPEIILFFVIPRSGIRIDPKRDGMMLGLVAALSFYVLFAMGGLLQGL